MIFVNQNFILFNNYMHGHKVHGPKFKTSYSSIIWLMEGLERYVIFFFQAILLSYQCVSSHYTSNFFHLPGSTVRVTAKEWPLYWESCHCSLMLLVQWDWTIVACLGALQTHVMHDSQNFCFSVYHHPHAKQTSYYEYQHNGTEHLFQTVQSLTLDP